MTFSGFRRTPEGARRTSLHSGSARRDNVPHTQPDITACCCYGMFSKNSSSLVRYPSAGLSSGLRVQRYNFPTAPSKLFPSFFSKKLGAGAFPLIYNGGFFKRETPDCAAGPCSGGFALLRGAAERPDFGAAGHPPNGGSCVPLGHGCFPPFYI